MVRDEWACVQFSLLQAVLDLTAPGDKVTAMALGRELARMGKLGAVHVLSPPPPPDAARTARAEADPALLAAALRLALKQAQGNPEMAVHWARAVC